MKRIIAISLILMAANFIAAAALSSQPGFAGITGPADDVVSTPGTDVKKVEDKMADALAKMDSWKKAQAKEKIKPVAGSTDQAESSSSNLSSSNDVNSTDVNLTSGNVTSDNSSIISPPGNSSQSIDSSSGGHSADAGKVDPDDAGVSANQKIGSSSEGRFKGYYGLSAARHEMGKSGINSHMFLSGDFEMDKTVKFQDQGID